MLAWVELSHHYEAFFPILLVELQAFHSSILDDIELFSFVTFSENEFTLFKCDDF